MVRLALTCEDVCGTSYRLAHMCHVCAKQGALPSILTSSCQVIGLSKYDPGNHNVPAETVARVHTCLRDQQLRWLSP